MQNRSKLLLAALTATLMLSVAVTSASAGRLSVNTRNFTITWSRLQWSTTGGIGPIRCPTTLSGSFHSNTIAKVRGALIGLINRGTYNTAGCTGGRSTVNQEALPWHIRYNAFRGTLPNITGLDLAVVGAKVTLESGGITCTTQTTATNPLVFVRNVSSGVSSSVTPDSNATIPLRGSFFCGFAGNWSISETSTTATSVTITLI
jgi:phospholipase/lecithinase/hemolysin